MFHDLCLSVRSVKEQDRELAVRRAIELGYSSIAWNTTVPTKAIQNVKATQPYSLTRKIIDETAVSRSLAGVSSVKSAQDFKQYTRITVIADDATDAQSLTTGNAALMKFDIVAASPRSLSAFLHLCKQADIDIICLDFSHRMTFHIDQKHVAAAVKRGIFFEITYSPIIQASSMRRQVMEGTSLVVEYMRGKQFVLASDAEGAAQLRGPHDVVNIGCVVGLPEEQARRALCENCGLVLQHAYSRKLRHTSVEIVSRQEFATKWSQFDSLVGPVVSSSSSSNVRQSVAAPSDQEDDFSNDGSDSDSLDSGLKEINGLLRRPFAGEDAAEMSEAEGSGSDSEGDPPAGDPQSTGGGGGSGSGESSDESAGPIVTVKKKPLKNGNSLSEDILKFENAPSSSKGASDGSLATLLLSSKYKFSDTPKEQKSAMSSSGLHIDGTKGRKRSLNSSGFETTQKSLKKKFKK